MPKSPKRRSFQSRRAVPDWSAKIGRALVVPCVTFAIAAASAAPAQEQPAKRQPGTADRLYTLDCRLAAFAPDTGESALQLTGKYPGSTLAPTLAPPVKLTSGASDLYIQPSKFHEQFAADVPAPAAALMAAGQRPIADAALAEPSTSPAWRTLPSLFVYGDADKNIPARAQAFMAERAKARRQDRGRK